MAETEKPVLSNKEIFPDDEYVFPLIGNRKIQWINLMNYISETHNDFSGSWKYYNDGKQWLFKMVHKKNTIFWLGVLSDTFRISFWFGDKAIPLIEGSDLPQSIKDDFRTAKKYGAIRAVSVKVYEQSDVENVIKLIKLKDIVNRKV
jgi:hypothetical protein